MLELTETEKVIKIVDELNKLYKIREFVNKDPYKVLVRTILSQRTRDENTDQATKNLFGKYKNIYEKVFNLSGINYCVGPDSIRPKFKQVDG